MIQVIEEQFPNKNKLTSFKDSDLFKIYYLVNYIADLEQDIFNHTKISLSPDYVHRTNLLHSLIIKLQK